MRDIEIDGDLRDEYEEIQAAEADMTSPCPYCGEHNGPMGSLGSLVHYSCRYCGIWYN